ncbi:MAG: GxxExxY protein [Desulfobacteraceae bacterium]|nr:GxxExxY protein [Desulfobacteraceae bacterium]
MWFFRKSVRKCFIIELKKMGFHISQQYNIKVYYDGVIVGDYFADIIVEDNVIIELKSAESLRKEHKFQLINYLKATEKEVGLLLNFGKTPEFKRAIFTND